MKIAHGENATHDRTVERHLVSKRAHYAFVEDRIAHEGRVAEARSKLAEANKAEGTPCRNGHFSERYTSSGACAMCDKIGWEGGKLKTTESHES